MPLLLVGSQGELGGTPIVYIESDAPDMKKALEEYLELFREYHSAVFSGPPSKKSGELQSHLRRNEPKIKGIIIEVLGNSTLERTLMGRRSTISANDLITTALMTIENLRDFHQPVITSLERAIGTLEAGLWTPMPAEPALVILDDDLRNRCLPLLEAGQNYDTVIREATTILEDRIRSRPPHSVLTREIPHSADQSGDTLINKLCNPEDPVLSVSSDRNRRIAFRNMLIGVTSYLRNPYHHALDPSTERSWAWSTVGLIDRLLKEIGDCTVVDQ